MHWCKWTCLLSYKYWIHKHVSSKAVCQIWYLTVTANQYMFRQLWHKTHALIILKPTSVPIIITDMSYFPITQKVISILIKYTEDTINQTIWQILPYSWNNAKFSRNVTFGLWYPRFVNLLVLNVNLSWRTVRVFKSVSQPNVDLTWREYVSNLEGLCSPLHVT
jgi:hypothetical protein